LFWWCPVFYKTDFLFLNADLFWFLKGFLYRLTQKYSSLCNILQFRSYFFIYIGSLVYGNHLLLCMIVLVLNLRWQRKDCYFWIWGLVVFRSLGFCRFYSCRISLQIFSWIYCLVGIRFTSKGLWLMAFLKFHK
jgi:hypothetical protein